MTKKEVIEQLKEIKLRYPLTEKIIISYDGSGDSFEGFDEPLNEKGEYVKIDSSLYEDICHWLFDQDEMVDFNNEGCYGTITLDLKNSDLILDNSYYTQESTDSKGYQLSKDLEK